MFEKKCTYCKTKIPKGKEILEDVKVPEFTEIKTCPFCTEEHAKKYQCEITGTKRTRFCPSCPI